MSDREKFLEQKISYLEPEETELEGRGKELEINAPVTGSVTIPEAVVAAVSYTHLTLPTTPYV